MKQKIIFLITGCIATVTALAAIQGYFIYNTYKLKEKEVVEEVRKHLLEFEDSEIYTVLNDKWMERSDKFIRDFHSGKVDKKDYAKVITQVSDSISRVMIKLKQKNEAYKKYKVGYAIYVTSVVTPVKGINDTIYSGKLLAMGDPTGESETSFGTGIWERTNNVSEREDGKERMIEYFSMVKTHRFYSISNWQKVVLGKMAGLLIFSVALLIFVVVLFYLSLKNLITQKKISDIKTDFINNITHEFQTPIATMDIAIKTLQRKENELSKEGFNATLSVIERQNTRLQKLFAQVTEASLAPKEIVSEGKSAINCKDIMEIVSDFKLSRPDTTINCHAEDTDITLNIDRFYLNTVLINLLDNAVKYGAKQVDITIESAEDNGIISVKDNGPGIPLKEQAHIFDKFYRVEKGNIHNTKGLGLGLYYTRQVIEANKGTIAVNSETGKGAQFIITIPLS